MRRYLPPLNPLRMFDAAARHVSFTRAAEELGVTQAAISRQIAVLESFLKIRLFDRRNSQLALTEEGKQYLQQISQAFDIIDASTTSINPVKAGSILKLRAYHTFAVYWLIPRLHRFRSRYPEVTLNLTTSVPPVNFEQENVDMSITFGSGIWPGLKVHLLLGDAIAPVCSPKLLGTHGALRIPGDIRAHTALVAQHRTRDWTDWLQSVKCGDRLVNRLDFESSALAYQAAKEGIGIAMGQMKLLKEELDRGDLVMPFDSVLERKLGYYLVYPARLERDRKVRNFRDWILSETANP